MRIIAKKTIVNFYTKNPKSKDSLEAWSLEVSDMLWTKPGDVIKDYSSADVITGKRFVFNIKGNHYRLITDIEFKLKIIFVVWIGTHSEYDNINVKELSYVKNN